MNRNEFRLYMNEYKLARESNPSLSYWLWKANKYAEGTDEVTNTVLPEVVVTPNGNYINKPFDLDAYNSAMLDAWGKLTRIGPEDVIDYVPVIGDIKGVYDVAKDFANEEYLAGTTGLVLAALPNIIEKPLRRFGRKLKRNINLIKELKPYNRRRLTEYNFVEDKIKDLRDVYGNIFNKYYTTEHPEVRKQINKLTIDKYRNAQQAAKLDEDKLLDELNFLRGTYNYDDWLILHITDIINEDPNYALFILNNRLLNPLSQEAVNLYLTKNTTAVRGVSFSPLVALQKNINDIVNEALTVNTSRERTGGDRLNTGRTGIYVSNSGEIADRFSRPMGDVADVRPSRADVALVRYPYINDETLPIEQQLRNFRRSIYPYDLFGSPDYKTLAKNGFIAKEAQYTTRTGALLPGYERAYFAEEPNQQLLNIVDLNTTYTNVNKKGRWALNGVESLPELESLLFEGYRPGNSFGDFVRFARFRSQPNITSTSDAYRYGMPATKTDYAYELTLRENLNSRKNKLLKPILKLNNNMWLHILGKFENGTDGIVDELKSNSRTTLTPEELLYLLSKSKQRQRMSGAITPVFDIQDAVDFTPKKYTKWFNTIPLLGIPGAVMYSGNKEDNSYAEGSDGVMQSYLLPEIVVTPSEYLNYYMKNIRPKGTPDGEYFLRGLLPEFRTNITKEELDKVLKNLIDIYEYAGKPTINYNGFRDTAYYIPLFNSMNSIKDTSDLLAELAHPIQRKIGKNNNFIRDGIKNAINRMTGKNTHYVDKNNYEYETHRIIEPKLRQYIRNGNGNLSEYLQK